VIEALVSEVLSMTTVPACPEAARLQGLVSGTLTEEEEADLIRHLDSCASCRRTLDGLAGEGLRLPGPTAERAGPPPAPEPALEQVVAKLVEGAGSGVPPTEVVGAEDLALPFLTAPGQPGHLGRLGHYEILAVIGRGGMGIVLKARDEVLNRIVAIKVMAPQLAIGATARQRFIREARAAAAVRDEHVIDIHAVDEGNGLPYMVMEYVDGVSLQERLDRRGPVELEEALRIGVQAARGLAAAHAQGLVHRDVKPANILLENGIERVKLGPSERAGRRVVQKSSGKSFSKRAWSSSSWRSTKCLGASFRAISKHRQANEKEKSL